jgi:hypothetical protein
MVRTFLKVYMELGSYVLFLQEQIKDIIIMSVPEAVVLGCNIHGPAAGVVHGCATPTEQVQLSIMLHTTWCELDMSCLKNPKQVRFGVKIV